MRGSAVNPKTLIEAAVRARELMEPRSSPRTRCSFEWVDLPEAKSYPPPHSAVDGGSRRIDTETRTVFALKAWGGVFNPSLNREEPVAYVGTVVPPRLIDERIGIYREILEAYAALRVVPENGILLMDGSIRPVISWWMPVFTRSDKKHREMLNQAEKSIRDLIESGLYRYNMELGGCVARELGTPTCVEEILEHSPIRPGSAELAQRYNWPLSSGLDEWIVLLEVLEKLYLYRKLLVETWSRGSIPVFITKTSRQTGMCNGDSPDVHYIAREKPVEPGYTLWEGSVRLGLYSIAGVEEARGASRYLDIAGLGRFYEEKIALVEIYARLKARGPILLVDIVVPSDKLRSDPNYADDIAQEILSSLLSIPGGGYPAPLFIAHHKARITSGEVDAVKGILGLDAEAPKRAMLEF